MAAVAFEELEKAACCLLQIIRDTPELGKSTKAAIAGDMALRRYLPKYRHEGATVSDPFLVSTPCDAPCLQRPQGTV